MFRAVDNFPDALGMKSDHCVHQIFTQSFRKGVRSAPSMGAESAGLTGWTVRRSGYLVEDFFGLCCIRIWFA